MRLLLLGLSALPLVVLGWLTFGRRAMRVSGIASELPVGDRAHLFDDPLCRLEGLVVTELVALKDDLLVGYRGGTGSWFTLDPANFDEILVSTGLREARGELFLPMVVLDQGSMSLLYQWCDDQTRLDSVVARSHRIVALADRRRRNVVIAELSCRL